jgi:bacteriorhodopsin
LYFNKKGKKLNPSMSDRITTLPAATILLGTAVVQAIAAWQAPDSKSQQSNTVGALVCAIAFLHYFIWIQTGSSDRTIMNFRYSDWLFTLPLLLIEICLICEIDITDNIWLLLLTCLLIFSMLGAGWTALRKSRSGVWLALGFLCLALVYGIVLGLLDPLVTGTLPVVAIVGFVAWILYGAVAVAQRHKSTSTGQSAYDVLDVLTKAVFGLIVASSVFLGT